MIDVRSRACSTQDLPCFHLVLRLDCSRNTAVRLERFVRAGELRGAAFKRINTDDYYIAPVTIEFCYCLLSVLCFIVAVRHHSMFTSGAHHNRYSPCGLLFVTWSPKPMSVTETILPECPEGRLVTRSPKYSVAHTRAILFSVAWFGTRSPLPYQWTLLLKLKAGVMICLASMR